MPPCGMRHRVQPTPSLSQPELAACVTLLLAACVTLLHTHCGHAALWHAAQGTANTISVATRAGSMRDPPTGSMRDPPTHSLLPCRPVACGTARERPRGQSVQEVRCLLSCLLLLALVATAPHPGSAHRDTHPQGLHSSVSHHVMATEGTGAGRCTPAYVAWLARKGWRQMGAQQRVTSRGKGCP